MSRKLQIIFPYIFISVYYNYIHRELISMNNEWFAQRLFELRNSKNVSARDMSLSLGQSESYINKIENQKALPSMNMFFYMCEYLAVTPEEFFSKELFRNKKMEEIDLLLKYLSHAQLDSLKNLLISFSKTK